MKAITRAVDKFCRKHSRFGIPKLMLFIVLITGFVFIVAGPELIGFLAFRPGLILRGEIWRLITWIFLPLGGNIFFTLISLYFYYMIGTTLEREWGNGKFTIFYLFGIVLNIIYGFVIYLLADDALRSALNNAVWLTPTYLNLSMFFAFATLFPEFVVRLFFFIPLKVKWLAVFNAAFFVYAIIAGFVAGQILSALLPIIALLNYLVFCADELIYIFRPLKARTSPNVINFKSAAKKAKKDIKNKPYRHKCAVCGKTDVEHPDLEFRYCSQCDGYHCFCIDHINNHVHF